MVAERFVSAYVVVEFVVMVVVVPCTTCRIRNAPRRLFSDDAGRTLAAVNDEGRLVGVAINAP